MRRSTAAFFVVLVIVVIAAGAAYWLRRRAFESAIDQLWVTAQSKMQAGEKGEAVMLLDTYVRLRPENKVARRQRGLLLLEQVANLKAGWYQKAAACLALEQVLLDSPDDMPLRLELAKLLLGIRQFSGAVDHLKILREQVVEANDTRQEENATPQEGVGPSSIDVRMIDLLLANALTGTGQFYDAIAALGDLVNFDAATRKFRQTDASAGPTPPEPSHSPSRPADTSFIYMKLAFLLQNEVGDADAAALVLERGARDNPGNAQIWMSLADQKRQHLHDVPGALEAFARATALAPDDPAVLSANFRMHVSEKNRAGAEACATRARELHPDEAWVYAAAATLALQDDDVEKAIASLVEGVMRIGASPALLQPLVDLPGTAEAMADLANSMGELRQALPPNDVHLSVLEARLQLAAGKSLDAKRALEKVRPLAANDRALLASIDAALGACHQRLGERDLQFEAYDRALSIRPDSVAARAGVATALFECGQRDAALARVRELVAQASPGELAGMPQLWRPLVRLESEAIRKLPTRKADWTKLDAIVDALAASPGFAAGRRAVLRAEALAGRGRKDEAIAVLDEAAGIDPADALVQAARLSVVASLRNEERFHAVVGDLPSKLRGDPEILRSQIDAAHDLSGAARARLFAEVERWGSVAEHDDDAMDILDRLVSVAIADGRLDDADRIARRMVERCPHSPRAGLALCAAGRIRDDADTARAAAEMLGGILGGDSSDARLAAMAVRVIDARRDKERNGEFDKGRLRDIRDALQEIEHRRPHWPDVIVMQAELDLVDGNPAGAIAHFTTAAAERPRDEAIARQLVALLVRSRQLADAERAIGILDDATRARLGRLIAEVELLAGSPSEAVEMASQAVAAEICDAGDLVWCAGLLRDHGRGAMAEQALEQATRAAPTRVEPWLELLDHVAAAAAAADRIDATLARGLAAVPESRRPLLQAEADRLQGRSADAAAGFAEALAAADGDVVVLRYAARGLILVGHADDARVVLEGLVNLRVSSDSSREARAWARRALVELTAQGTTYATFMRGLDTLKRNAGGAWTESPEDAWLAISMLADRPEPQCWRRAVDMLDALGKKRSLATAQRVLLAGLRYNLGDPQSCRSELLALAVNPDIPPAVCADAVRLLIEIGEIATAERWLDSLVEIAPEEADTIALQSRLMLAKGDRPAAVQAARRLLPPSEAPVTGDALVARARLLEELGFRKASDVLFERAAGLSAGGVSARVAALGRRGGVDEALSLIEDSWEDSSIDASLRRVQDLLEARGGAIRGASADRVAALVERARADAPDSPEVNLLHAQLLVALGDVEVAERLLRSSLDRDGLSSSQRVRAVAALIRCGSSEEIPREDIDSVEAAIRDIGPLPELLDARGIARLSRGDARKAAEDFREACLARSPLRLLHLAFALCEAGDFEGAGQALAQAPREALDEAALIEPDKRWLESVVQKLGPVKTE